MLLVQLGINSMSDVSTSNDEIRSDPIRSDNETTFPIRSDPKSIFLFRSPNESDRIGSDSDSDQIRIRFGSDLHTSIKYKRYC